MASHMDHKSTERHKKQQDGPLFGPQCVAFSSSLEEAEEDWLSQRISQHSWLCRHKSLEKQITSMRTKHGLDQTDKCACVLKEQSSQRTETGLVVKEKKADDDVRKHLCSRHGKRMKSILQECSEELKSQHGETPQMQVEGTPLSLHTPLLQSTPQGPTSASPLDDSSSTNISLFSQPESFSYLSGDDEQQVVTSQLTAFSQTSPGQANYPSHVSSQEGNISLPLQLSISQIHLITTSSSCSVQTPLSQTLFSLSSSSTNISPFPEIKNTQKSSSTEPSLCQECSHHQPFTSSSSSTAAALTPSQTDAQVSLSSQEILEPSRTFVGKLKLSLETQAFLLVCKWLQPQVKLRRLSQQECHQATLPNHTREQSCQEEGEYEDDVSFDVNLLYSDSESDKQDSDDSEYVPSKRCRYN